MNDEEKKEYERLKSLLYTDSLTQYGKRKLIGIIEKQQKEIKIQEDMIDEMVCELSTEGYLDDVCQMKQDNDECDDCCNLCIKEYFRKKVERK